MTGDVNLTHARAAAKILRNLGYETTADGLTTEARRAEAVIQAARAYMYGNSTLEDIRDALAALGDSP